MTELIASRRPKKKSRKSQLEERFAAQLLVREIKGWVREHRFAQHLLSPKGRPRQWRFDFAWPKLKVAVEVQGGVWSGGAHGRGSGIRRNYEKYNAAAVMGWRLLQGDERMVTNCALVESLVELLEAL